MTVVEMGAHIAALASPMTALGSSSQPIATSGDSMPAYQNSETASRTIPVTATFRGFTRSMSLPTMGASPPESSAIGTSMSADCVGVRPRTVWKKNTSGRDMQVMVNPTAVMAALASEKLRSRNSLRGSSGSPLLKACHTTNRASMTRPPMMRLHTLIEPTMVPQL